MRKVPLPMRPDDVVVIYADVTRLKQAAGFVPCTTLETGIRRFLEWRLETTPGG